MPCNMLVFPANKKLSKTEFNNQEDWESYPTADYTCDKCGQKVSLSFSDFRKHQLSGFSNLTDQDKEMIKNYIESKKPISTNSFLDFYCPKCKRPVRVCYDSWAGGKHTEAGFSIKYVIE